MALHKSIWRPGIVKSSQQDIMARGSLKDLPVTWLPPVPPYHFLADPFGIWRNNRLYVFAEAYDYWECHGHIDVLIYDEQLALRDHRTVLCEPWHLSYPYIFESDNAIWMLPEGWKSSKLTLYRASHFPYGWKAAFTLDIHDPVGIPIDATPYFYQGKWWLFYSPQKPSGPVPALHIAYADRLDGKWTLHPQNPICTGKAFSRPGGTICTINNDLALPVQDCSHTYGGGIKTLYLHDLSPGHVSCSMGPSIAIPSSFSPFTDGFHTLSAIGNYTLIDVKYRHFSWKGLALELRHQLKKHFPSVARSLMQRRASH